MRKAVSLPMLFGCLLFLALASIMYQSTLDYLLGKWEMPDYTYSYFIPLVSAYLIWEKRSELALLPARRSWNGIWPVFLGILLFWTGELGGEYTIMYCSAWLLGAGALWCCLGWRQLRAIAFPVCLVLVMIPPPMVFYNDLTLRLKLLSSQLGVLLLRLCGLTAYREGNVIDLGFTKLQVVDACSGLRYLFPLIILGILLAYFFRGALWKKFLVVLSAIPISIFTNGVRIASVGVLYQFMGPAAAEGFFHDFSGWFIFMISLGIMLAELALLKRIAPEAAGGGKQTEGDSPRSTVPLVPRVPLLRESGRPLLLAPQFLVILLLMGGSASAVQGISERHRTAMARPFSAFPGSLGGWSGRRQALEQMYLDELNLSDYLLADFRNGRGQTINCYVAFSDFQSKGKTIHSPASCLPGTGWELENPEKIALTDGAGRSLVVNRAVMTKGSQRQLTYYWFVQRDRTLTDLYQVKLFNMVDSVALNRTDGALVRLIAPLAEGEATGAAEARLREFFRLFNPALGRFLPPVTRS
jgi:exosortase D (VPLPA-CTERM-specific)